MRDVLVNQSAASDTKLAAFEPLDLTLCDREPIHIPGSIQPHGLLLVARVTDQTVLGGAGDIEERLRRDWLSRPLAEFLTREDAAAIREACPGASLPIGLVKGAIETFDCVAHIGAEYVLIEFELAPEKPVAATDVLAELEKANSAFEQAMSLKDLCQRAATAFRELTAYDRVMIYRFLDDDSGVVIAEDRDPSLASFLNHHFPATDIPKQARALYIRNRVRVIPNVGSVSLPFRPEQAKLASVDLSAVLLRSVSPIHIQYLKNMGVEASASISIVRDGILWGLIACHNNTPRVLPLATRLGCEALASGLARQIRAKEEAELYRERVRLRSAEDTVLARLKEGAALADFLQAESAALLEMVEADGFTAICGEKLFNYGHCPESIDLKEIVSWVANRAVAKPFHSSELGAELASANQFQDVASGLLATTISLDDPIVLMWFRAEQKQVVRWAGDPHKSIALAAGDVLKPRASFESWSEIVSGKARAWTLPEIEAAGRLTGAFMEFRRITRIRDLNLELAATIADKDLLLKQKDYLIKEVNHRVQNSLQLVSSFLAMQAHGSSDEKLIGHLNEAQNRLSAVALVHRRLYADDKVDAIDLARYLEDLCKDIKSSMGAEWSQHIATDFAPMLIATDRAVNVGLVLTELMINANKYAYGGHPGSISVSTEQFRNRLRLIVADQGVGRTGRREGFGTRMLKALVNQLSGVIDETTNNPGLRIIVTCPI